MRIEPLSIDLGSTDIRLLRGSDKLQIGVVLVLMKAGDLQRGAGRQFIPVEVDRVVITAQRELPDFVRSGSAAGPQEVGPRQPALHHPAAIAVGPRVERSVQRDFGFEMKVTLLDEPLVAPGLAPRQEHVHHSPGRVDLELVVPRLVGRRLEKQFEDVVVPRHAVVLGHVGKQVRVIHLGQEIQELAIPREPRPRRSPGRPRFLFQPRQRELVDHLRRLPHRIVGNAVDLGGSVYKPALVRHRLHFGRQSRRNEQHAAQHLEKTDSYHSHSPPEKIVDCAGRSASCEMMKKRAT